MCTSSLCLSDFIVAETTFRANEKGNWFGFVSIGGFVAGTVATAVSVSFALVMNGGIILAFVGKNGRSLRQLGTPIAATPQAAD